MRRLSILPPNAIPTFTCYHLNPFNWIVIIITTSFKPDEVCNASMTDICWHFLLPFWMEARPEKDLSKNRTYNWTEYRCNANGSISSNPCVCQASIAFCFLFTNTPLAEHATSSIHIRPSELNVNIPILHPFYFPTSSIVNIIFRDSPSPTLTCS